VANGAVILCAFGDPEADARAAGILGQSYPGRTVELVDARDIFAFGGGIHCITQQQPAAGTDRGTPPPRGTVDGDV
jgi:agmatine deiminase